jgi:uncharacterized protein (TIGR00255 family)
MTGFGLGDAPLGSGKLVAEIRAVNARYFDVRVRLPRELADHAMLVEQVLRERATRGRFEIGVRSEGAVTVPPALDRERARAAWTALRELRDELAPGAELPFATLTAVPDLFAPAGDRDQGDARAALRSATIAALEALDGMRAREGAALADDLTARAERVRSLVASVRSRSAEVVDVQRRRLRARVERLLGTGGEPAPALDPARLEQEIALLADRADVTEELTRLGIHVDHFLGFLRSDEPTGRRLDFLLQEMGREINTVGAKSQDAAIAHAVVEAKSELERMREQVQNVE